MMQAQAVAPAGDPLRRVTWPIRSGAVPPLADGFVDRLDTVPGIEAELAPGAPVALISGGPGAGGGWGWPDSSGKTQLSSYLAESLWRSQSVDLLAWVTATSRASVLSGYVQAAARLGLDDGGDAESVAARLLAWLSGTDRQWLVVLDGVHDAADLDGLLPDGPAGRVLITAADAEAVPAQGYLLTVPVSEFSMREAMSYLLGRLTTDQDQRTGAIDLITDLACEPTALTHAAAVMISSGTGCREYVDYFRQQREWLQASAGGELPSAAVTWMLSADYAEELLPGGGTWPLLVLAALLDGNGIPGTVLTAPAVCKYLAGEGAVAPPDPQRAWSAVLTLERTGLMTTSQAGESPMVWVPAPLQAAARAAAPRDLLTRAVEAAADALLEAWPEDTVQARSGVAARLRSCAASLQRNAADALWAGGGCHRVLLTAGQSMTAARLAGPAVTWCRDLAANCELRLGGGHPDTMAAVSQLAEALLTAGQSAEAVSCSRWVLAGRIDTLGPDHSGAIAARVGLGRALAANGRADDAVAVLEEAVARSERTFGTDDPVTLVALDEYATACLAAGNAASAVRCLKRSLAAHERLHGPADSASLATGARLADSCLAAGKVKDAIAQYKRVLAGREQALGPDHPGTLAARASLAVAYDAVGKVGAALSEHKRVCLGYERTLGPDHPQTLAAHADLARAYYTAGQLGDAISLLRDNIARSEQGLSPGDPVTLKLRQVLDGITAEMSGE
jgi:tetratricopeptide (TPR) repeat protein